MTIRRSALLIGVGDTPRAASRFGSLAEPVARDLDTALERAAQVECELLVVYFTGHGVHAGGSDCLVPGGTLAPEPDPGSAP